MSGCIGCGRHFFHDEGCTHKPKKPVWRCWNPEDGDEEDGRDCESFEPEFAATEFAEQECSDDPDYYSSYEAGRVVMVKGQDGIVHRFNVGGEISFTFTARSDE